MKFGKIYDYRNKEEAKKLIGKKVIVSDIYYEIIEEPNKLNVIKLESVRDCNIPFYGFGTCHWQFMREVIEEEKPKLMTNRQLAEWLVKGNGEQMYEDENVSWCTRGYDLKVENESVPDDILIRSWGSDEWVVPTVDIYERDCKGENK